MRRVPGRRTVRGESGPVAWEVSDIREGSEDQGRLVRWTFTVTLRNTGPTGITLTMVTRDVQAPSSDVWGGQENSAGQRRLDAGSVLRLSEEFAYRCRDCDIGYAASALGRGSARPAGTGEGPGAEVGARAVADDAPPGDAGIRVELPRRDGLVHAVLR